MKIVIVGKGVIGGAVARRLEAAEHQVIVASRSSRVRVDVESRASIQALLREVRGFDALVFAAGEAWLGPFAELDEERLQLGLRSKLMGQLNLVLEGRGAVAPRGSFTLTSGFLSSVPVWGTAAYAVVNGGIEAFVTHAAVELAPVRINVVSPGAVAETVAQLGTRHPPLLEPVAIERVVQAYVRSVTGRETGKVFAAW